MTKREVEHKLRLLEQRVSHPCSHCLGLYMDAGSGGPCLCEDGCAPLEEQLRWVFELLHEVVDAFPDPHEYIRSIGPLCWYAVVAVESDRGGSVSVRQRGAERPELEADIPDFGPLIIRVEAGGRAKELWGTDGVRVVQYTEVRGP